MSGVWVRNEDDIGLLCLHEGNHAHGRVRHLLLRERTQVLSVGALPCGGTV